MEPAQSIMWNGNSHTEVCDGYMEWVRLHQKAEILTGTFWGFFPTLVLVIHYHHCLHSMYCIPACNLFGCSPSSELLFRDALDNSSRAFLYSLQLMRKEERERERPKIIKCSPGNSAIPAQRLSSETTTGNKTPQQKNLCYIFSYY